MKIFDIKPGSADDDLMDKPCEFETAKKILSSDIEAFDLNLEPPKIEKPSSIADKVLKALNQQQSSAAQQQQQQSGSGFGSGKSELPLKLSEPHDILPPIIMEKPTTSSLAAAAQQAIIKSPPRLFEPIAPPPPVPMSFSSGLHLLANLPEPPKIELPAIIKKDIETPPKKPVLSSPEHKLDILESIAPKNNDLSETIQKLESVIQQRVDLNDLSDDSTDSTDSEQRLIIEDESLSSETQNDFSITTTELIKKDIVAIVPASIAVTTIVAAAAVATSPIHAYNKIDPVAAAIKKEMPITEDTSALSLFGSGSSFSASGFFASVAGAQQKIIMPPDTTSIKTAVDIVAAAYAGPPVTEIKLESFELQANAGIVPLDDLVLLKKETPSEISILTLANEQQQSTASSSALVAVPSSSTHNESISLLLCEETIPGSPAPPSSAKDPIDQPTQCKKEFDSIFASPHHPSGADIKSVPMDIENADVAKIKTDSASVNSSLSPRGSLSHDDSSEDVRKIGSGNLNR